MLFSVRFGCVCSSHVKIEKHALQTIHLSNTVETIFHLMSSALHLPSTRITSGVTIQIPEKATVYNGNYYYYFLRPGITM